MAIEEMTKLIAHQERELTKLRASTSTSSEEENEDYRCPFNHSWRCPNKEVSEGRGKCQLKESKPFDDSIKAYIESWDCPIAIKEDGDDADHT